MKRTITWIMAILLCMSLFPIGASAEEANGVVAEPETAVSVATQDEAVSNSQLATEIEAEAEIIPPNAMVIECNKDADPTELIVSGTDIELENGTYNYRLMVNSNSELTFDNDLQILYQGIDGKYKLHYAMDQTDNHIMVVDGTFNNIMVESPLLQKGIATNIIRSRISEDTYSYQLDLRTEEGFTYTNSLTYLFNGNERGYAINYAYDLLTDTQTLVINSVWVQDRSFAVTIQPIQTSKPLRAVSRWL